ncbi:MAG: TfoX/Sxy family protein [Myxococcota bacterium]
MSTMDRHLEELFVTALQPLELITRRPMFGCDSFFARGNIFGLVWDGRVVLKLPDRRTYEAALAMAGALPWKPMPAAKNPMSHWVVMGESLHDDAELFGEWVTKAYQLAMAAPAATPAPPTTSTAARREVVFRAPTPTPPWKRALEKKRAKERKAAEKKTLRKPSVKRATRKKRR